ncbi:MAG: diaminopimelate epimerase [Burkholderiaceae bacterium]
MRVRLSKMHGAGNDFIVLDETRGSLGLSAAQRRWLADRHLGVGADQLLTVRPPSAADADFDYIIHNADGQEVEQCGNGARCLVRFVRGKGLTNQRVVRARVRHTTLVLEERTDGLVQVDMGAPLFEPQRVPFDALGLNPEPIGQWLRWHLDGEPPLPCGPWGILSMGNPHVVQWVDDVQHAPVGVIGRWVQAHRRFGQGVNVGFMQRVSRHHIALRVYERGVGETLSCGTGACAAAVAGMRWSELQSPVTVDTRGGRLQIEWEGGQRSLRMAGPAEFVFDADIDIPDDDHLPEAFR